MASKRNTSTAVMGKNQTILETILTVLADNGNQPLSPAEIATMGKSDGLLRIPRGRTEQYLAQLVQSSLYNNLLTSPKPAVSRVGYAKYKATKSGLNKIG